VASVVFHDRLEESPCTTEVGEAVSVQVGGGGVTVIDAVQFVSPPGPVTVSL
jgi:hypothetical protein